MSDPEGIDEVFRGIGRFAEYRPGPTPIDDSAFVDVHQIENEEDSCPEDELILGDDYVTYLVFADEHEIDDFLVIADDRFIEVKTFDFTMKREFGMRVDAEDPLTTYSNGILSVKLKRIEERDSVG